MFDKTYIVPSRPQHISVRTTIQEKRAPTDESVKLLREMEQKARDQVIEAVKVGDTRFECVVQYEIHPGADKELLRAVFSVNGKKLTAERPFDRGTKRQEMVRGIRDEIALVIANQAIDHICAALPPKAWGRD